MYKSCKRLFVIPQKKKKLILIKKRVIQSPEQESFALPQLSFKTAKLHKPPPLPLLDGMHNKSLYTQSILCSSFALPARRMGCKIVNQAINHFFRTKEDERIHFYLLICPHLSTLTPFTAKYLALFTFLLVAVIRPVLLFLLQEGDF